MWKSSQKQTLPYMERLLNTVQTQLKSHFYWKSSTMKTIARPRKVNLIVSIPYILIQGHWGVL